MTILAVGSLAYDDVETPAGKRTDQLGGAAVFFSLAASRFADVGVAGVVGKDFAENDLRLLADNGVDTSGIERAEGLTFRWQGHYMDDLNTAVTIGTQLNVFEGFKPKLSPRNASAPFLFLANIHPDVQLGALEAMSSRPEFVACDTMNLWIDKERGGLRKLVGQADALLVNEAEAASYTGKDAIREMADALLAEGLKCLLIKRGEYGVALFTPQFSFMLPAFPLRQVKDPTGAGDSFAGGFIGYLAQARSMDEQTLRRAAVAGSVMASFTVSEFGTEGLLAAKPDEINARFRAFGELTSHRQLEKGEHLPLKSAVTTGRNIPQ